MKGAVHAMLSKERVRAALRREKPDRVPFNFWMDRRLLKEYEDRYGEYFRVERYGADIIEAYMNLQWPQGKGVERDGTVWVAEPLWAKEWQGPSGFMWPDPAAPENFAMLERELKNQPDKAVIVNVQGITTIMHGIRAEGDLYADFFERPDDVQEFFARFGEVNAQFVTQVCERYPAVTAIYVQDDICGSNGVMFSPDILDRFIYLANDQPIKAAREAGKPAMYHSDGKIDDVVEHFIELGVCAINPLQPNVNDFEVFMARFGGRIAVFGGLDNCFVIPDGTPEQVREHVLHAFHTLGSDGGLILSSHDIAPHCPEENIETLVRTICEECTY
jgi:uroporphyrinogen decarboxylase